MASILFHDFGRTGAAADLASVAPFTAGAAGLLGWNSQVSNNAFSAPYVYVGAPRTFTVTLNLEI